MARLLALLLISPTLLAGKPVADLLAPRESFPYQLAAPPGGWAITPVAGNTHLAAPAEATGTTLNLRPATGDHWDLSAWAYLQLSIKNTGRSLLSIEGRLDNKGAEDWNHSSSSETFLLPGESAILGFPFHRAGDLDDSPAIFAGMAGKPNGWRSHWKPFDPAHILQLRLRVQSAQPAPQFELGALSAAWPYGSKANATVEELPFLDRFGQVRQLAWPGKLRDEEELRTRHSTELASLAPRPATLSKFGGWKDGPQLAATGRFRLERHDGKWWFVDPEGFLFWSHGVCSVGFDTSTPLDGRRALFEWIPAKEDPLHSSTITHHKDRKRVNFLGANLQRKLGPDWKPVARDLVHRRFASWGLNTLGAWSEDALQTDRRTAYTPIFHVNHPEFNHGLPQPYGGELAANIRTSLASFVKERGHDPWILGVFIGNEIHWSRNLATQILTRPGTNPAKIAAHAILRQRHPDINALNKLWGTTFADWDALAAATELPTTEALNADLEAIQSAYANEYYRICRDAVRAEMPGTLYLGSRVHSCPDFVSHAAAAHVDVFSINHYEHTAGLGRAPANSEVPVMITEFHFGTVDRGVPGASLGPVHDQRTRARAYQLYVASALAHPRIVGTHWFAWSDQSSAGRPGENYQIGLVDITDTPGPELTRAVSTIGHRLYELRTAPTPKLLQAVEPLMAP